MDEAWYRVTQDMQRFVHALNDTTYLLYLDYCTLFYFYHARLIHHLCCDRFDRGSRQVKCEPVDLVMKDYDVFAGKAMKSHSNNWFTLLLLCTSAPLVLSGNKIPTGNGHKLQNAPQLWLGYSPPTSLAKHHVHARFCIVNSAACRRSQYVFMMI